VLAYEPAVHVDPRFVLYTNGDIASISSDDLRSQLDGEKKPLKRALVILGICIPLAVLSAFCCGVSIPLELLLAWLVFLVRSVAGMNVEWAGGGDRWDLARPADRGHARVGSMALSLARSRGTHAVAVPLDVGRGVLHAVRLHRRESP